MGFVPAACTSSLNFNLQRAELHGIAIGEDQKLQSRLIRGLQKTYSSWLLVGRVRALAPALLVSAAAVNVFVS